MSILILLNHAEIVPQNYAEGGPQNNAEGETAASSGASAEVSGNAEPLDSLDFARDKQRRS